MDTEDLRLAIYGHLAETGRVPDLGPEDQAGLLALHDRAGIQGALLFGEPWPIATATRDLAPGRIVPFLAEGYANALHRDSSYMNAAGLEQLFAANVVRGLGEIICRDSPYRLGVAGGLASAPANHQYQAGFAAAMMLKDLVLSQQSAQQAGVETPLAAQATAQYQAFNDAGFGELDFSAIILGRNKPL